MRAAVGTVRESNRKTAATSTPVATDLQGTVEADVPVATRIGRSVALYVATDLTSWETPEPEIYAPDVTAQGRTYRRLDAAYYAWLRHRMGMVRKAVEDEQVQPSPYQDLRVRFNAVHAWAIENLGEAALRSAVHGLDVTTYSPPQVEVEAPGVQIERSGASAPDTPTPTAPGEVTSDHQFPVDGTWRFTQAVGREALNHVDAIREKAIALGWSEARLYQNRGRYAFPSGEDYGLVCFVRPGEQIVEVTGQAIAVQNPAGNTLRFYNQDVDQPWCRKVPVPAS